MTELASRPSHTEFLTDASTNPKLVALARLNNPGQVRTEVPMLIVQGIGDNQVPAPLDGPVCVSDGVPNRRPR